MKTYQGQWRLSQIGSELYQHLLTRTSHHHQWAKSKKATTVKLIPVHVPPSTCASTWARTGYSNYPFTAFEGQCYLPYWNLKQNQKLLSLALNFPSLAPASPGSAVSDMPARASFKLICSDLFLLKGHTAPVYLKYAKVSITFLSQGQYGNELRSKLTYHHLLRKAKKKQSLPALTMLRANDLEMVLFL